HRASRDDGDVAGIVGAAVGHGDQARSRDGKRASAVSAGGGGNMVGDLFTIPVGGAEADLRVTLIVVLEVDAAIVGGPFRALDVAVEFVGNGVRAGAVTVHQVKLCRLVALKPIIEAGVGDRFAIRGDCRRIVRAFAAGESAQRAIGHAEFVNLRVE